MPSYYEFTNAETGRTVELDKIDQEMCLDFGERYSTMTFSMLFQVMTMIGDFATRSGSFLESDFHIVIRKGEWTDSEIEKIRKYIYGKYIYHSWTQRSKR